ncbi:hypothetical protein T02_5155 [Trichinella nativa]|uniref:Uncharacterized protein n=1 Tax=Trichinella nativa TaxID=6335 RepID=A0A0V1LTM2_9BILA|nr:hypothetical protein T06_2536 [Trichinella sp. T6]KRZ62874.1 hypothetical protein T02_5155 [Trichinella nativa]
MYNFPKRQLRAEEAAFHFPNRRDRVSDGGFRFEPQLVRDRRRTGGHILNLFQRRHVGRVDDGELQNRRLEHLVLGPAYAVDLVFAGLAEAQLQRKIIERVVVDHEPAPNEQFVISTVTVVDEHLVAGGPGFDGKNTPIVSVGVVIAAQRLNFVVEQIPHWNQSGLVHSRSHAHLRQRYEVDARHHGAGGPAKIFKSKIGLFERSPAERDVVHAAQNWILLEQISHRRTRLETRFCSQHHLPRDQHQQLPLWNIFRGDHADATIVDRLRLDAKCFYAVFLAPLLKFFFEIHSVANEFPLKRLLSIYQRVSSAFYID